MNWRNPDKQLPEDGQVVFAMLEPHKVRGGLLDSAASIQIVCGWVDFGGPSCVLENNDELGMGAISWNFDGDYPDILAWLPVEEMSFPDWKRK